MLGVRRQTSSLALYGDTGQFPIIVLQEISVLKYWCHILSLPPESVVRRADNTLIQLDRSGKQNWVSHVKWKRDFMHVHILICTLYHFICTLYILLYIFITCIIIIFIWIFLYAF